MILSRETITNIAEDAIKLFDPTTLSIGTLVCFRGVEGDKTHKVFGIDLEAKTVDIALPDMVMRTESFANLYDPRTAREIFLSRV
jgi:hypothetical protein